MTNLFQTIIRSILLVWRASRKGLILSVLIALIAGAAPVAGIYINAALLQAIVGSVQAGEPSTDAIREIIILFVYMGGLAAITELLNHGGLLVQRLLQAKVSNHAQNLLVHQATLMDLECFENPTFHNDLQLASNEANFKPLTIVQQLLQTVGAVTTLVGVGSLLWLWSPWIIPFAAAPAVLYFWISTTLSRENVAAQINRTETERAGYYIKSIMISDRAAKEVRLLRLNNFLLSRLREIWQQIYTQDRILAVKKFKRLGIASSVLSLSHPLLIGMLAWNTLKRQITIGQFSLYSQAILTLYSGLIHMMENLSQLHVNGLFVARLYEFIEKQPVVERAKPQGPKLPKFECPIIEFENVSFKYPGSAKNVIEGICLRIEPGQTLAIVGENGSGKSTLVKLLAGLYEPTEGRILIGGIDVSQMDRTELRKALSIVFQDFQIYHLTTRENIGIGEIERIGENESIEAAAAKSGFDTVVATLPDKYDTVLGRHFIRGHELSGGQRQLAALSRALFCEAPILVLDEPTASLDINAEAGFYQKLFTSNSETTRTTIFICHRLTSIRYANRIVVLNHGKLVESGTHHQLLQAKGEYSRIFELHVKTYGEILGSPS